MGTTCIRDSISNEVIKEGDEVVSFILRDHDGGGRKARHFNPNDIGQTFQMATLPVRGVWNGVTVEGVPNTVVDQINLLSVPVLDSRNPPPTAFSDMQAMLQAEPFQDGSRHALSVIKLETLEMLRTVDAIKSVVGNSSPETESFALNRVVGAYKNKQEQIAELVRQGPPEVVDPNTDVLGFRRRELSSLGKVFSFEKYESTFLGFNLPYSARALEKYSVDHLSKTLLDAVSDYAFDASESIKRTGQVPDGYGSLQKALYDTRFISDSLGILGLDFSPSRTTSFSPNNTATLQFSKAVLFKELNNHIADIKEFGASPDEISDLKIEIASLKIELAVSVRKSLEITNSTTGFEPSN
jgi:hypothetical protein